MLHVERGLLIQDYPFALSDRSIYILSRFTASISMGTEDIILVGNWGTELYRAGQMRNFDDIYIGGTPDQNKRNQNPFQTPLYAFQIRRRASVTPTSLVSNSYRPIAVVKVNARRSHWQRE